MTTAALANDVVFLIILVLVYGCCRMGVMRGIALSQL